MTDKITDLMNNESVCRAAPGFAGPAKKSTLYTVDTMFQPAKSGNLVVLQILGCPGTPR